MTLEQHLAWLMHLMSPPYTYGMWPHVQHRAAQLAADPELATLPALVEAEYRRLKATATPGTATATQ